MSSHLHFFLSSAIVTTLSIIASIYYLYLFKITKKEKTQEAFYIIFFFVANIVSLLTFDIHGLLNTQMPESLESLLIFISSSLYVLTFFSLRQAIFLRSNLTITPLRKNKWLYISVFLVPLFCNCYLFYYLENNLIARILSSVTLMSVILLSTLFHSLKNKTRLHIADKFLIFIFISITVSNTLIPILLYFMQITDMYIIIFNYLQVIQVSLWTMTFIIIFILDMIHIQYKTSIKDSLTGLYNREYFTAYVTEVLSQSTSVSSFIFIDIDFFKKVNDTYGHPAGDFVIKTVAATIKEQVAKKGVVARFGGEEFIVFYQDMTNKDIELISETLRKNIESLEIHHDNNQIAVTISIGVSTLPSGVALTEGLKQADNALYKAKRNGRNQVCYF